MKMIFSFILCSLLISGNADAQEWIPMQPSPPVISAPIYPTYTYSTYPVVQYVRPAIYQAVPVVVNQPVIVEQQGCLFWKRQYVVNKPQIQWYYQLVFINPSY
jgi:hypothetical protein